MLLVDAVTYDPATGVLTARYRAPSRSRWAVYQYRDVAPELFETVRTAGHLKARVIARDVAPGHRWRRAGAPTWCEPAAAEEPVGFPGAVPTRRAPRTAGTAGSAARAAGRTTARAAAGRG